ncbi:response regulator transcription factor [Sulfurimonas sp.]|jgi:DNA-binding response OmpR family regulator|uniref:response regulator transcription factor n=1 Tax=Sulfurimonas sp. TaxID=2022749 RepID=UPI0025CCBCFC|nr:response regulator transcription factor [Sulfurimonas sp.]MBT5934369.1 response regulator transcription factor [Sulfurimonas sp.]
MNLLLVEDDELLAGHIAKLLSKEKYKCDVASNSAQARELYDNNSYQLILMDWNLPDGTGLDLIKEIREYNDNVSVLMLSGRESVDERVQALDVGADDYLCKPYSNIELLARIRAILRRESSQKTTIIKHKNLMINLVAREVSVNEQIVSLTEKEFEILELLMLHKNKVLSRFEISELLAKSFDAIKSSNYVDVHVKNIRKKTGISDVIATVRGIGYSVKDA